MWKAVGKGRRGEGQNTVAAISEAEEMTSDLRQNKTMKRADNCSSHNQLQLECGCSLPLVSAACSSDLQNTEKMPVAEGMLNGKKVLVLRDSGSSCVLVRKCLVEHSRMFGRAQQRAQ